MVLGSRVMGYAIELLILSSVGEIGDSGRRGVPSQRIGYDDRLGGHINRMNARGLRHPHIEQIGAFSEVTLIRDAVKGVVHEVGGWIIDRGVIWIQSDHTQWFGTSISDSDENDRIIDVVRQAIGIVVQGVVSSCVDWVEMGVSR